ncbi:DUF4145 domain-containing protein [Ampullimonas aquatilis]|uniref:DUF4145 domain-containing protein n=1 Tax=Ampullimonas aquatilis TaxID=1341549 RepID=UPI003C770197
MTKPARIKVLCRSCKHPTNHDILFNKDDSGETGDGDIRWWADHQVLQCCGCDDISFRTSHSDTESVDPYTGMPEEFEVLYPNRTDGRPPIDGHENFPQKTRRIYSETLKALNHNALILGAIGLRALIESVCLEQKTKAKVLAKGIDELAESGLLSKKQAKFLHAHRFMGNVAAHEMIAPKATELVAALDIAETLLKTIYILPEVAEVMKQKVKQPDA